MSNSNIGFTGRFKLVASKADGSGVRELTDWFDNLIVNSGLDSLGAGVNHMNQCNVGSGSSVPVATNTTLDSSYAQSTDRTSDAGASTAAPWYKWLRFKFRFPVGVAAGNISEIGVFSSGVLWSRTLVKDAQGNTTTITVLSDEVLDVYYELRIFPPENDVVANFTLNGTQHTATLRASNASSSGWAADFTTGTAGGQYQSVQLGNGTDLGPVTGTFGAATSTQVETGYYYDLSWYTYIQNSMQRRVRLTMSLDRANFSGGIGGANLHLNYGDFQVKFDPPIPKTNQMVLRLDFMLSWARRNIV